MVFMSLCTCLLTTFEKEIKGELGVDVRTLTSNVAVQLEGRIAQRLDAHTSNIADLINQIILQTKV